MLITNQLLSQGNLTQKQDYKSFGKTKTILSSTINKYLYNAKELQVELDEQYDYDVRFYDTEEFSFETEPSIQEISFDIAINR